MVNHVTAKLGNMRKPQEFVIYPPSDKDNIIVQSDKSIGAFNIKTGEGVLNTKGCYFPHLNPICGAKPFVFPTDFVLACIKNYTETGQLIGTSPITGPVYMGTVTEF
jgi:hypothetical protein